MKWSIGFDTGECKGARPGFESRRFSLPFATGLLNIGTVTLRPRRETERGQASSTVGPSLSPFTVSRDYGRM
jgi:hypothetical protein